MCFYLIAQSTFVGDYKSKEKIINIRQKKKFGLNDKLGALMSHQDFSAIFLSFNIGMRLIKKDIITEEVNNDETNTRSDNLSDFSFNRGIIRPTE